MTESETVEKAMLKFRRRGRTYKLITMATPLEELERFFNGEIVTVEEGEEQQRGERQGFAVVTDATRKFVLGVVTREDLEQFVKRRPA